VGESCRKCIKFAGIIPCSHSYFLTEFQLSPHQLASGQNADHILSSPASLRTEGWTKSLITSRPGLKAGPYLLITSWPLERRLDDFLSSPAGLWIEGWAISSHHQQASGQKAGPYPLITSWPLERRLDHILSSPAGL
jgi:hypothetical protein